MREIEKVWDTLNTEHLFTWEIKEGRLFFPVNASQVLFDEQFDGCCILQTNIQREELPACEIFSAYQKLHPIQQSFKSIKTASTKFCAFPVEQRIQSHMLLSMLSYYLEWHITKKLKSAFKLAQEKRAEKWTLAEAIERLKSIRSQTVQVAGMVLEQVKTTLDQEQEELISALEVRLQPT